jgi:hypothetical protein
MQKGRIQVPVTPEHRAMLQAYADATGATLTRTCQNILAQTAPLMLELSQALQEANQAPAAGIRAAKEILDRKVFETHQLSLDVSPKATDGRRKKKA